jgi:lysophospholipase L1-like esterase
MIPERCGVRHTRGHARGRLRLQLGIALGSILLAFGGIELAGRFILTPLLLEYSDNQALKLQLASPKDLGVASLYTPHHYSLYTLRPSYRSSDGKTRHNSRGCRAEEFRVPKPPGVYRIIALGGSTTYSTTVRDNGDVFTYRLQALLNAAIGSPSKEQSFEVINCGVPGFTSAETLVRYIFVVSEHQPDLLIVQQGLNDVLPRSLPTVSRDYREFSKTWSWEGIRDSGDGWFLGRLLYAARNRFQDSIWTQGINYVVRQPFWDRKASGAAPEHLTKNPSRVFESNTRYLIRLAAADGARVLLLTEHVVVDPADRPTDWLIEGGVQAVLEHDGITERLAREEGTLFLDLQKALCACGTIMPDGRHLNEEGERQKAQVILEYLKKELTAGRWTPHGPRWEKG